MEMGCFLQKAAVGTLERPCTLHSLQAGLVGAPEPCSAELLGTVLPRVPHLLGGSCILCPLAAFLPGPGHALAAFSLHPWILLLGLLVGAVRQSPSSLGCAMAPLS